MRYCVQCGHPPPDGKFRFGRCLPCFGVWDAAGRNKPVVTVTESGGIRIGHTSYGKLVARFCRDCRGQLRGSRIDYALRCGGECHTCDECYWTARMATPSPHP